MDANSKKKKDAPAKAGGEGSEPAAKRLPIKMFRQEDISSSIWTREVPVRGEVRTFYSVTFERSYKDRDGMYRYTKSFDPDSLGKLATVIQQTAEYLSSLRQDAA